MQTTQTPPTGREWDARQPEEIEYDFVHRAGRTMYVVGQVIGKSAGRRNRKGEYMVTRIGTTGYDDGARVTGYYVRLLAPTVEQEEAARLDRDSRRLTDPDGF